MRRDTISSLVLQLWLTDTDWHWQTLIRAPDHHQHNQGNRPSRAEMESSLQVPRLSGAVPVSGCDAIRPRDNHISTTNKTHENTRTPPSHWSGREMWGVWQSELYWELGWVTHRERWSDQSIPGRPPVFTGMPWDHGGGCWLGLGLSAHSRTLFYSPPLPHPLPSSRWIVSKMTIRQDLSLASISASFCIIPGGY